MPEPGRWAAVLVAVALAAPRAAMGQAGGAWHEVQTLRAAIASDSSAELLSRAIDLELRMGRPERAQRFLDALAQHRPEDPRLASLRADVEFANGEFDKAARHYAAALQSESDPERAGLLAARGADAFAAAGSSAPARELYAVARSRLRVLAGWIAVREAGVAEDTTRAFALLAQAPAAARRLVAVVRGTRLLAAGDTAAAVAAYAAADRLATAAALALDVGDTALARQLTYRALAVSDTVVVGTALSVTRRGLEPQTSAECLVLAGAYRRVGNTAQAVRYVEAAVERGDSTAATLRLLGDVLADDRQRGSAIEVYARAASLSGSDAARAMYLRGRLLVRVGRRSEGYSTLLEFADRFPGQDAAPVAMFVVADGWREAGRTIPADSLFRMIARRWPRDDYAARARFQLANLALARRDTAGAVGWYEDELRAGGSQAAAARFLEARLRQARGDSTTALRLWRQVAAQDPVGYYGSEARRAAGMVVAPYPDTPAPEGGPVVAHILSVLDYLDALGWSEEAGALVQHAVATAPAAPEELLALGTGLIARGRVAQGVTLGWRATGVLPLTDPSVLRVIFPWPMRALIEAEAEKYRIDPYLLAGLIRQESTFRVAVVSRAGATGLMQLMPATASGLARRMGLDWDDRLLAVGDANLHVGAAHLADLLRRYDGSVVLALAAYNAGGGSVDRWMRSGDRTDDFNFVEQVPYPETRGYIRSVLRNRDLYQALYPPEASSTVGGQ